MLARPCLSFSVKATKRGSFLCADSGKTASRLWKFCNCLWLSTKFHMQILGPDYRYLIIYLIYAAAHGDAARGDSLTPRQSRPRMGQNRAGWDRMGQRQYRHMRNANNAAVVAVARGGPRERERNGHIINLGPCGTLPGHGTVSAMAHGTWCHLALGCPASQLASQPRG